MREAWGREDLVRGLKRRRPLPPRPPRLLRPPRRKGSPRGDEDRGSHPLGNSGSGWRRRQGLGQRELEGLPLRRNEVVRHDEEGRVHDRSRGESRRQSCRSRGKARSCNGARRKRLGETWACSLFRRAPCVLAVVAIARPVAHAQAADGARANDNLMLDKRIAPGRARVAGASQEAGRLPGPPVRERLQDDLGGHALRPATAPDPDRRIPGADRKHAGRAEECRAGAEDVGAKSLLRQGPRRSPSPTPELRPPGCSRPPILPGDAQPTRDPPVRS